MKTFAIGVRKGGEGKTTLARHVGFYAARILGLRTLLVDGDVNRSLSRTGMNLLELQGISYPKTKKFAHAADFFSGKMARDPMPCLKGGGLDIIAYNEDVTSIDRRPEARVIEDTQKSIDVLSEKYDLCIIDTVPVVSNAFAASLGVADAALCVSSPDEDSISGAMEFHNNVLQVKESFNPKLVHIGLLMNMVDPKWSHHLEVVESLRASLGSQLLTNILHRRAAIELAKSYPVWDTTRGVGKGVAATEMLSVCKEIVERIGV